VLLHQSDREDSNCTCVHRFKAPERPHPSRQGLGHRGGYVGSLCNCFGTWHAQTGQRTPALQCPCSRRQQCNGSSARSARPWLEAHFRLMLIAAPLYIDTSSVPCPSDCSRGLFSSPVHPFPTLYLQECLKARCHRRTPLALALELATVQVRYRARSLPDSLRTCCR
jgi:hypothetical protein